MAALVHALDLERSRITLALSNCTDEEGGGGDAQTRAATLARPALPEVEKQWVRV